LRPGPGPGRLGGRQDPLGDRPDLPAQLRVVGGQDQYAINQLGYLIAEVGVEHGGLLSF
jgi:hypothetical protein